MFKRSFQLLAKEPLTLPAELGVPIILGTCICVHTAVVVVGSSLCLMRCLVEGLRVQPQMRSDRPHKCKSLFLGRQLLLCWMSG